MLTGNFKLIEGSLYRSPLRLLEAFQGDYKRSWDLGYRHARRGREKDPSGANDPPAYMKGFNSEEDRSDWSDENWDEEHKSNSYDVGREHRELGKPRNPEHPDVRHKDGYEDGYRSAEERKGAFPQDSWDAGHAAADAGEFADPRHPGVGDPHVYLSGYRTSMDKRPDPRTDDPDYAYTPAEKDYYTFDPDDHIQLLIDRWQQAGQQPDRRSPPLMVPVSELWLHREYERNPEHSRGGPAHWHKLKQKLAGEGWNPDDPLDLRVGRERGVKVGEGNHRLAIAKELGIEKVPVHVTPVEGREKKLVQHTNRPIPASEGPSRTSRKPPPRGSVDDDALVKELSDLV